MFDAIPGQEEDNAQFLMSHGMAVRIGKGDSCAKTIQTLLQDEEKLRRMKESCEKFDKSRSVPNMLDLIHRLLEEKERGKAKNPAAENAAGFFIRSDLCMKKGTVFPCSQHLDGMAELFRNVVFACPDGKELKMQILCPWRKDKRYPLVVFVQGSAWTTPNPDYELPQLGALARQGFVVASVSHRDCRDGYAFPAFLQDVKTAIRFLRAHAAEYCIDKERVGIWGTSSGGNAALLVGHDRRLGLLSNGGVSGRIRSGEGGGGVLWPNRSGGVGGGV